MGQGSKVGVAIALAIGCALIYIALAGNASKLLALFGTASQPATTTTNATSPGATALAPVASTTTSTTALALPTVPTIGSIESAAGLGLPSLSGTSLLQSELGITSQPAAVTGSLAGTASSLYPPTFSGGTYNYNFDDLLSSQPMQAQAGADTGITYVPQATAPAGLGDISDGQVLGLDSGGG